MFLRNWSSLPYCLRSFCYLDSYGSATEEQFTNGVGSLTGKDWLNNSALLEAFEARSARLAVACAMRLSEASDSEAG